MEYNKSYEFLTDYSQSVLKIRNILEEYIVSHNIKSLVVGVSGGIDSALVCALAKPVCDKLNIPLIGRSISIATNKADEEERARGIGKSFCTDFEEINMHDEYLAMLGCVEPQGNETDTQYKIRLGNIKARMRMIKLYDLAQANKGLGLSTDNLTELLLGFWTLHGDVFDLSLLQYLWKTEVYGMTQYIIDNELDYIDGHALESCIYASATDGLGITQTDLDQILPDWRERHSNTKDGYKEVDEIFMNYFKGNKELENTIPVKRYFATMFKRDNPHVLLRNEIL